MNELQNLLWFLGSKSHYVFRKSTTAAGWGQVHCSTSQGTQQTAMISQQPSRRHRVTNDVTGRWSGTSGGGCVILTARAITNGCSGCRQPRIERRISHVDNGYSSQRARPHLWLPQSQRASLKLRWFQYHLFLAETRLLLDHADCVIPGHRKETVVRFSCAEREGDRLGHVFTVRVASIKDFQR